MRVSNFSLAARRLSRGSGLFPGGLNGGEQSVSGVELELVVSVSIVSFCFLCEYAVFGNSPESICSTRTSKARAEGLVRLHGVSHQDGIDYGADGSYMYASQMRLWIAF